MLVPVEIKLLADYVITARPISGGQAIAADDLGVVNGDLGELPDGIVTDPSQAIGRIARGNLPAGRPLRADLLKAILAVHSGQTIKVTSRGNGFSVTNEGVALNQGAVGEVIRVRLPGGQVVSGKAKAGGEVEIGF
jgi:flagella basal body P-ring formation protein FlgA